MCTLYVLIMYLTNVPSCCTHIYLYIYIGENEVGLDSRRVSYFLSLIKNKMLIFEKKAYGGR